MKVWFGCTTAKFNKYKKNYFAIRDYLKDSGYVVVHDWLEYADKEIQENKTKSRDVKKIFNIVTEAIDQADFSVIEYTVPNFSSSHQINYSLYQKKPVLVLRLMNDNEYYSDSYIEALDSKLLTIKKYDLKNYKNIIDDFVKYNVNDNPQNRYNVVLGMKEVHYLDWASVKYKKSKSQIIREALDFMSETDRKYRNTL